MYFLTTSTLFDLPSFWIVSKQIFLQDLNSSNKTSRTLLEKHKWTRKWRSSMDTYTWMYKCWPTNKNLSTLAVWIQEVVWKTCQEQWMIGADGERKSRKSMETAWLENEDEHFPVNEFQTMESLNLWKKYLKNFFSYFRKSLLFIEWSP